VDVFRVELEVLLEIADREQDAADGTHAEVIDALVFGRAWVVDGVLVLNERREPEPRPIGASPKV